MKDRDLTRSRHRRRIWMTASCLFVLLAACKTGDDEPAACQGDECVTKSCDDFDPLRRPLFGDTHIHTSLSFDANVRGTRLGPEDAYRYARGESIGIQPYDENGNSTRTIQRSRPLDFVAISDHAEFLGTVVQCTQPDQPGYGDPQCELFREDPFGAFVSFGLLQSALPGAVAYPGLCGEDAEVCIETGKQVWQDSIAAAEAEQDQTSACEFTALIGYEWTGNPQTNNLHRNVIFRNGIVPDHPTNFFDEGYIEGLWERLREDCTGADTGCDVLTIPHNSNIAGGTFFETVGRDGPFDSAYAAERAFMEPLIEIYQHKGESECVPGQTATDEFCGFEKVPFANFGAIALNTFSEPSPRDYLRSAFGEGMKLEQSLGTNPFKHGIVASTDTHISAPGSAGERDFPGHSNVGVGATASTLPPGLLDAPFNSPGGLAAVWAEENSREAIFLAMRRKEAFGTSGPQIVVRLFGGWSYPSDMCDNADFPRIGYEGGVPMGGDLPPQPSGAAGPTFALSAIQDPTGTPLQRIQIIKGWLDGAGEYQTEVFEVGGNPDNGATVSLDTCEPNEGSGGSSSLCSLWTDPSFDPDTPAYYYARVIENPTCRWSQWQCNGAGVDCNAPETVTEGFEECCDLTDDECSAANVDCDMGVIPEGFEDCCRPRVPKTIQERAWTSPIWYTPG